MFKYNFIALIGFFFITCSCSQAPFDTIKYSENTIDEAAIFAKGVISSKDNSEFDIMFSPNGRKAYFSRRAPGQKQKIYETAFIDGIWIKPKLCDFSIDRDETPSISQDGKHFFFGSERPIPNIPNKGNFDMNIWMMEKDGDKLSTPKPLPFPINDVQLEGEEWPSSNNNFLSAVDSETYYYTTMIRGEKSIKLYQTQFKNGTFSEPVEIKGIFSDEKYWIYSPVVSPDGKYLIFNSYGAPGGTGGEDIFVSIKKENGWSEAKPIGSKVNSKHEESSPRFSRDGNYFFFSRAENLENDEYGEWSIYFIETEYLDLDKLFQ